MPLSGRNLYNLIALQPGVTGKGVSASISGGGGADDSFAGESAPRINASGQRDEANSTPSTTRAPTAWRAAASPISRRTPSRSRKCASSRTTSRRWTAAARRADPGHHQVRHQPVPRQRLVLLSERPAVGAQRLRDRGAEVRQEPVRLQPGRADREERAVLLHLVRRPAPDRRARIDLYRRDARVPQLRAAARRTASPRSSCATSRPRSIRPPGSAISAARRRVRTIGPADGIMDVGTAFFVPEGCAAATSSTSAPTTSCARARIASTATSIARTHARSPAASAPPSIGRRRTPRTSATSTTRGPSARRS